MSQTNNWLFACERAKDLSLPLIFALTRAGIRKDRAEKYAEGLIVPKEETVDKFNDYLNNIEKRRKKFYAV